MTWMFLALWLSTHPTTYVFSFQDGHSSRIVDVRDDGRCFAASPSGEMVEDNGPICQAMFRFYRPNTTQ